jgi:hypothetical protein
VDLDGDGIRDVVSGSYMPGDIFLFRGLGQGQYAPRVKLMGADGKPTRAGLASAVAVADWNKDGRPDLVVGNIEGVVSLLPQIDKKDGALQFGARKVLFAARGVEQETDGVKWMQWQNHAGPFVADWDGDGIDDLLVGFDNGSVQWMKGSRDKDGLVTLAAPEELIPVCPSYFALPNAGDVKGPFDPVRSGEMVKLALADWNADGNMDLLVGDLQREDVPEPVLTDEQKAERKTLESQRIRAERKLSDVYMRVRTEARKTLGLPAVRIGSAADVEEDENAEKLAELEHRDAEYMSLRSELEQTRQKLSTLTARRVNHGYVWVYLRKSASIAK